MRHRSLLLVLVVVAVGAASAPSAQAKGIERVLACGADGCTDVTQRLGIGPDTHAHVILGTGRRTTAPRGVALARLDVGLGDGTGRLLDTITLIYAPTADRIRSLDPEGRPAWFTVRPEQRAALRRAIAGLRLRPGDRVAAARADAGDGASVPLVGGGLLLALLGVAAALRLRPRRAPPPYGAA